MNPLFSPTGKLGAKGDAKCGGPQFGACLILSDLKIPKDSRADPLRCPLRCPLKCPRLHCIGADFWAGDPTKHFSVKRKGFSVKRGEGFSE